MIPLAVIDPDTKEILLQLKEIYHRCDFLEKDLEHYSALVKLVGSALLALGLTGYLVVWNYAKRVIKKKVTDAVKQAEENIRKTDALIEQVRARAGILEEASAASLYWETGDYTVEFINHNYIAVEIPFKTKFAEVPQVFVGEQAAGEWVFVKVDDVSKTKFKFAARSLSGLQIKYLTHIQWLAVSKKPAKETEKPTKDFVPIGPG